MASAYSTHKKPKKAAPKGAMLQEVLNKLMDREREVEELKRENRTLQTIQRRHEKELGKKNTDDDELPALLARKDNEIALFAKQAKLYKEKWSTLEKDLKKYQKQLQEYKDKNDELTKLVQSKNLSERATLQQEVDDLKAMLEARDQQIAKLEKLLELSEKMNARSQHQHQQQRRQDSSASEEVNSLRATLEFTRLKLAERERQLDTIVSTRQAITAGSKAKGPAAATPSARATPAPAAATPLYASSTPAPAPAYTSAPAATYFSAAGLSTGGGGTAATATASAAARYSPVFDHPQPASLAPTAAGSQLTRASPLPRASPMPRAAAKESARIDSEIAAREREVLALSDAIRKAEEARLAMEREEHEARMQSEESRQARARDEEERGRRAQEEAEQQRRRELEQRLQEEEAARRREEDERRAARQREEQEILARRRAEEEARVLEENQRIEREQVEARAAIERAKDERRKKDALLAKLKNLESGNSNPTPEKENFSFLQPAPAPAAPAKALPSWLQSEPAAAAEPKQPIASAGGPYDNMHRGLPARPELMGANANAGRGAGNTFLEDNRAGGRRAAADDSKPFNFLNGPRNAVGAGGNGGGGGGLAQPAASVAPERVSAAALPWEAKGPTTNGTGAVAGRGAAGAAGAGAGGGGGGGGGGTYLPSFLADNAKGAGGRGPAAAAPPPRKVERSFADDDDDDGLESMVI